MKQERMTIEEMELKYPNQSHSVFGFFRHFRGQIASTARSYQKEIAPKTEIM